MNTFLSFILGVITILSGYSVYHQQSLVDTVEQTGSSMTSSVWLIGGGLPKWYATVTDGCAEWSSSVLTTTGVDCGSGSGGGLFVYGTEGADTLSPFVASTSNTAIVQATAFVATSTATSSTFNLATITNASTTNLSATTLWGALVGNADTATALAANGANCTAGNAPLGVDASGAVESCFDVWTEAENTSAAYLSSVDISANTNLTVGATGIELVGDDIALTSGYNISLQASTTEWNNFYQTPSTRITAGDALTWTSNTLDVNDVTAAMLASADFGDFTCNGTTCSLDANSVQDNEIDYTAVTLADFTNDAGFLTSLTFDNLTNVTLTGTSTGDIFYMNASGKVVNLGIGTASQVLTVTGGLPAWADATGGGGSGAGWATTTDGGVQVTYGSPTNPVYIGGSASNTAEFIFDYRTSKMTIASSTAATGTIAAGASDALRLMSSTTPGIEFDFGTATQTIIRGVGNVVEFAFQSLVSIVSNASNVALRLYENSGGEFYDITVDANGDLGFVNDGGTEILTLLDATNFVQIHSVLEHIGDNDTELSFADDSISFFAGAIEFLSLDEAGSDIATALGEWDFGGATSIEAVNGTDPTINAAGEFAANTGTSSWLFHDGTAERQLKDEFNFLKTTIVSAQLEADGDYGASGSTTIEGISERYPITLTHLACRTSANTTPWSFGNGSATTTLNCGTSGASGASSVTFGPYDKFYSQFGTSSPSGATSTSILINATARWTVQ